MNKILFFNEVTKLQVAICKAVFKDYDEVLFLYQKKYKTLNIPPLFLQVYEMLSDWRNRFLTETSLFPKADTPEDALIRHIASLELFRKVIEDGEKIEVDVLQSLLAELQSLLDDTLGVMTEMQILLPTVEDIKNDKWKP